jgi:hypothetical protein
MGGPNLPFTLSFNAAARLVIAAIRATRGILEVQTSARGTK